MPPLTPSSSQEIVCISPPRDFGKKQGASTTATASKATTRPTTAPPTASASKRRAAPPSRPSKRSRSHQTEHMLTSLSNPSNPITHSDAYERTRHVHSCSTGHQQRGADRGAWAHARDLGLENPKPEHTYWSVRTANVQAGARGSVTSILSINGPTGPRVSNLQLQNLITANGGQYVPHQTSRCTHVVAVRLSGTKSQKYINGQGSRGASRRTRAVRVEWILDCVEQGKRLSEAGYAVVEDPTQQNLFTAFGQTGPAFSTADTASSSK